MVGGTPILNFELTPIIKIFKGLLYIFFQSLDRYIVSLLAKNIFYNRGEKKKSSQKGQESLFQVVFIWSLGWLR